MKAEAMTLVVSLPCFVRLALFLSFFPYFPSPPALCRYILPVSSSPSSCCFVRAAVICSSSARMLFFLQPFWSSITFSRTPVGFSVFLRAGSTTGGTYFLQSIAPWLFRVVKRNLAGLFFNTIPTHDLVVFFYFLFFGREVQFAFFEIFRQKYPNWRSNKKQSKQRPPYRLLVL